MAWCNSIAWSSSAAAMIWAHFYYASSNEDHFSTGCHLKKGKKQQSADPEAALLGAPWSSVQSYGEKGKELQTNETQTQPNCNSTGCTAALNWLCWLPKLVVVSGQGMRCCWGAAVCRVISTSQQNCMALPEGSINCWADLKYSLTQSSSSLPAL